MFELPCGKKIQYYGPEMINVESEWILPEEYDLLPRLREYMLRLMHKHNGIGLSAPQVGLFKQFYVMATDSGTLIDFVNPEIIQLYGYEREGFEACMSIPPVGNGCRIARCEKIRIEFGTAINPNVRTVKEFYGMDAIVSQHELDHLTGTFFIDRVSESLRRQVLQSFRKWKETTNATYRR